MPNVIKPRSRTSPLRHWAGGLPIVLVQPRPRLAHTPCRANDNPRRFFPISRKAVARLLQPKAGPPSRYRQQPTQLDTWCRAAGDAVACRSYGLDAADLAALSHVSATVLARWSQLPIADGRARPGLLAGSVRGQSPTRLIPFLDRFLHVEKIAGATVHALDQIQLCFSTMTRSLIELLSGLCLCQ